MRPAGSSLPTIGRTPAAASGEHGLRLHAQEVDIWRANLDEPSAVVLGELEKLLSADERDRASRFFFERDRGRFVVARGVLRTLLGRYLGRPPGELVFRYGAQGKPALAANEPVPIYFNLAHSEGLALYAFTRAGEIGIDLEKIRELPDWPSVAEAAFSPRELAQLKAVAPERRRDEFFRAWTRQEAVLKAFGTGLGADVQGDDKAFCVHPLHPAPGYAGALAAVPSASCPGVILGWNEQCVGAGASFERNGCRSVTISNLNHPLT